MTPRFENTRGTGPFLGIMHIHLALVVQTLDSAINRIKIYPVDKAIGFPKTYLLDSDLSGHNLYDPVDSAIHLSNNWALSDFATL